MAPHCLQDKPQTYTVLSRLPSLCITGSHKYTCTRTHTSDYQQLGSFLTLLFALFTLILQLEMLFPHEPGCHLDGLIKVKQVCSVSPEEASSTVKLLIV